jgi:Domain of unknown function DUF488
MFYRQKVLLGLLETFDGSLPNTDFQKYLFLYTRLCEKNHSYEFVPYKFGCFSFQSAADKAKLVELGYLEDVADWKLTESRKSHIKQLNKGDDKKLVLFKSKYGKLKGKKLLHHVYSGYPYYATNSLVAEEILNEEEFSSVKKLKVRRRLNLFATIGYEGIPVESYINKLIENDVRALVDVRKNPLSRKYGFSKSKLSDLLGKVGIEYLHMPELGIVSDKRKTLNTRRDYDDLFNEYERTVLVDQSDALKQLHETYLEKKRIAITCFEGCHTMCHRHKVSDAIAGFAGEDFGVVHL